MNDQDLQQISELLLSIADEGVARGETTILEIERRGQYAGFGSSDQHAGFVSLGYPEGTDAHVRRNGPAVMMAHLKRGSSWQIVYLFANLEEWLATLVVKNGGDAARTASELIQALTLRLEELRRFLAA